MRRNTPLHPLTVGLVWLAAAGAVHAGEIYKSVDANGNVVYSDRADPSTPQSTVVLGTLNTLPGTDTERDAGTLGFADVPEGAVNTSSTPPPLPDEEQSEIPEPGYLWTPGYWYWRDRGYFWIPGAWVRPPQLGLLWTPAFWTFAGTTFVFRPGHWGPTVGFYGGIDYGHGYFGTGYTGGRWVNGTFAYNRSVNRLSPAIRNTYAEPQLHPREQHFQSYAAVAGAMPTASRQRLGPAVATPQARTNTTPVSRAAAQPVPAARNPSVVAANATTRPTPAAPTVAGPPKPVRVRAVRAAPTRP